MELGVDVGGLDATLIAGYPGTVSSVWQQAGRSGRAQDPALSVLIARDHPVDQFYMQHPESFFDAPYESARVSTTNPRVMEHHLRCAAKEKPLSRQDFELFGEEAMVKTAKTLADSGELVVNRDRTRSLANGDSNPAFGFSIRSMYSEIWQVVDQATGEVLEKVDARMAYFDLYPGAVYMHKGMHYEVKELDGQALVAKVRPIENCNFYTTLEVEREIRIVERTRHQSGRGDQRLIGRCRAVGESIAVRPEAHLWRRGDRGGPAGTAPAGLPDRWHLVRAANQAACRTSGATIGRSRRTRVRGGECPLHVRDVRPIRPRGGVGPGSPGHR